MLNIGDFARLGQVSTRMLRHYDEIGLLRPRRVEETSGYRLYDVGQLGRLHRIVALRDLGFSLAQISRLLSEGISLEEMQGMLRLRMAQIEQTVGEEKERLRRATAHLRTLEWSERVELQDVVVKKTQPVRVALATAKGLSHDDIAPAFGWLLPLVASHLERSGVKPGVSLGIYEDEGGTVAEGELTLRAGFEIGEQEAAESDAVAIVDLPLLEVAAGTYKGDGAGIPAAWEALVRWIDESGYRTLGDCREIYHQWDDDDPSGNLLEMQQPIAR